ncbi:MAG: hypothetical protein PHC70_04200 [Patescibacteria group bacterium]|nr:hypothetical protein [Patescibacteria group bacterium]
MLVKKRILRQSHDKTNLKTPLDVQAWVFLAVVIIILIIFASSVAIVAVSPKLPILRLVWAPSQELPVCRPARQPKQIVKVLSTAYSSDVNQTDNSPCETATGYDVCQSYALYGATNTIASNFLPLHTVVKIPELYGDELFVVRDRMNDRFYNRVDVWMPTRGQAVRYGVKYIKLEIY